ncbi:inner membrane complex protein 1e [Plasmodium gonderi]|uniref:Inner membrane complex protein 1e n=1 Tax=Plasmodium gonderi TaxID=77519 RepID=A0A1Y1JHU6_PLAGO|nr:inner membrane complex protein 1e [Plasmodium gonderi]GAW80777.1 inner membrane complex protein 1e [Plasmodium gonderi]
MLNNCGESKCGGYGKNSCDPQNEKRKMQGNQNDQYYQVASNIFGNQSNQERKEGSILNSTSMISSNSNNPPPQNARILKPLIQEKVVEIMKPEIEEKIIEVPQVQYIEKLVEVPHVILQEKLIHVPKPVIHERIKKCPKTIFQEKIVEVPQIKVIDKIVEVPQYVYQEKIIEVPKIMLQERIIPVPKKVIQEKIVEIPQIELKNINIEKVQEIPEYIPEVVKKDIPYTQIVDRPFHVEKIVEVPHVQHIYRNIVSPQYRHIPKPVEVPMAHYRTFPIEKLVDRNVPVPVELQIVQEFLCPKIEARYKEIPVPVHVQRIIEHPIPKDAMNNPFLLPLYYQEDNIDTSSNKGSSKNCFMFNWNGKQNTTRITKGNNQPSVELLLHNDKYHDKMNNLQSMHINTKFADPSSNGYSSTHLKDANLNAQPAYNYTNPLEHNNMSIHGNMPLNQLYKTQHVTNASSYPSNMNSILTPQNQNNMFTQNNNIGFTHPSDNELNNSYTTISPVAHHPTHGGLN